MMKKVFAMLVAALLLCSIFVVSAQAYTGGVRIDGWQGNGFIPGQSGGVITDIEIDDDGDGPRAEWRVDDETPGAEGYVGTEKKSPDTGDSLIFPAALVLLSGAVVAVVIGKKKSGK